MAPVSIADRPLFERYFKAFPQEICEMTFTNMLLWGESRKHRFCEEEGHLLTSFEKRGEKRKWYPPVGPDPSRILREIGKEVSWLYLGENIASQIRETLPLQEERDRFDYIYGLQDLRELRGGKYAEKRNLLRQCLKHNPEIVRLQSSHREECKAMIGRWMDAGEHQGSASTLDEVSALHLAMEHFDTLGLIGIGIRINGTMEAFAIGAPLNATMFVEHFEKTSNAYPGLYALILHEFAKAIPAEFTHLNREEDLGIPGLRTAKERWHPYSLVKKYSLS